MNNMLRQVGDFFIFFLILVCVIALLSLAFRAFDFTDEISTQQNNPPLSADEVVARADRAVDSANLVLSFLEGASVLVTFALAAAALYGYRSTQDLRAEMREELAKIEKLRDEIVRHETDIIALPERLKVVAGLETNFELKIGALLDDLNSLVQAYQELNLRNYSESYTHVRGVLERNDDKPNVMALYVAGWLELQYIPNSVEQGLEHLRTAMQLNKNSRSIQAAYAVGLRRKARNIESPSERRFLWREACDLLDRALRENPNLIDLNRESFWGPLAGTYRDLEDIDKAIFAYEKALTITPNSSYPLGNLATLYLQKSKAQPALLETALKLFAKTIKAADEELATTPGDYFPMMDLAMANAVLSHESRENHQQAQEWLASALQMDHTSGMLKVSRDGWLRLLEHIPEDWDAVQRYIRTTIDQLQGRINDLEAQG